MEWYQFVALAAIALAALFCAGLFFRLIKLGKPTDFSEASGDVKKGIIYSATAAMSPANKESAYLHLPTYAAGIIYHIGTFAALLFLLCTFFIDGLPDWLCYVLIAGFSVSALCGLMLLVKRMTSKELKSLSSPDDYLSNVFTTLFQVMTALSLLLPISPMWYYLSASVLLLYIPVGKLKHLVYFFSARYHLGFFYGRRNSWPVQK